MPPKVTIGVPIYNEERRLAECLQDLAAQDYPNLEILIADNASTDRSGEIIEAFARSHPNVRVIRRSSNIGMLANFEDLVTQASGEFFFWAAADDRHEPEFTARLAGVLVAHSEVGVAMSGINLANAAQTVQYTYIFKKDHPAQRHLWIKLRDPFTQMSPFALAWAMAGSQPYHLFIYGLFRTAWLREALPFPRGMRPDGRLMFRYALKHRYAAIDDVLYFRLMHDAAVRDRYAEMSKLWQAPLSRFEYAAKLGFDLSTDKRIDPLRRLWVPLLCAKIVWVALAQHVLDLGRLLARKALSEKRFAAIRDRVRRNRLIQLLLGY